MIHIPVAAPQLKDVAANCGQAVAEPHVIYCANDDWGPWLAARSAASPLTSGNRRYRVGPYSKRGATTSRTRVWRESPRRCSSASESFESCSYMVAAA